METQIQSKIDEFQKMLKETVDQRRDLDVAVQQSNVKIEQLNGAIFALKELLVSNGKNSKD